MKKTKGLTVDVYSINVLPNTARQLVEAIRDQKKLKIEEALEMADYLDKLYGMSDFVPKSVPKFSYAHLQPQLFGMNLGDAVEKIMQELVAHYNKYIVGDKNEKN